jgi:AcrR family transcriptional regulator
MNDLEDSGAIRQMRADARRNYDRLVAAASAAFAEHGTAAPLDDIARRAGVGAGTLYRHFANREALLAAVYSARVEADCAQASALAATHRPDVALLLWLRDLVAHISTERGLSAAMMAEGETGFSSCKTALREAAGELLARAQAAGLVRPDLSTDNLLRLAYAVAVASESAPGGADQLLAIVMDGLRQIPR